MENSKLEIQRGWIMARNFCVANEKAKHAPFYNECQKCGSTNIDLHSLVCDAKLNSDHEVYFFCEDCGEIMK